MASGREAQLRRIGLVVLLLLSGCEAERPPLVVKPGDLVAVPGDRTHELVCEVQTAKLTCSAKSEVASSALVYCSCE